MKLISVAQNKLSFSKKKYEDIWLKILCYNKKILEGVLGANMLCEELTVNLSYIKYGFADSKLI